MKQSLMPPCYDNQRVHALLNRQLVLSTFMALRQVTWRASDDAPQLEQLLAACESQLEERFLHKLIARGIRLPDQGKVRMEVAPGVTTITDFYYNQGLSVYLDGEQHDEEPYRSRDERIRNAMTAFGYSFFVLRYDDDWEAKLEELRAWLGGH